MVFELDYTSRNYLPNSRRRVDALQKLVNGRPVAILSPGPSIYELEERIDELKDQDICFFGMNSFTVLEKNILKRIGKEFSLIMCSDREEIPLVKNDILDFLNRDVNNMFISSYWRNTFELMGDDFDVGEFVQKYDSKLLFIDVSHDHQYPTFESPLTFIVGNTLLALIQLAIIGKASNVILFGADGCCPKGSKEQYYRSTDPGHRGAVHRKARVAPRRNLVHHMNNLFNPLVPIVLKNINDTYEIGPIGIYNCSPKSFYTPLPIISYEDTISHLKSKIVLNKKNDLRTVKVFIKHGVNNIRFYIQGFIRKRIKRVKINFGIRSYIKKSIRRVNKLIWQN